jgi:hypothetical protein
MVHLLTYNPGDCTQPLLSQIFVIVKNRSFVRVLSNIDPGGIPLKPIHPKSWFSAGTVVLFLMSCAVAQIAPGQSNAGAGAALQKAHAGVPQSVVNSLSSLPEADVIIYASPQRILSEAAARLMQPAEIAEMHGAFADLKNSIGLDPATIDYIAVAIRFNKPSADLSFVAPDALTVIGGDFSAESLLTVARLYLQDRVHDEQYGSKTMTLMRIDSIAEAAEKNPMLKSFVEIGAVQLNANTIAIGNLDYLKAAVDAANGKGRIGATALTSLLRDPDALVSAAGSPLTSFAKSFGLQGTQTTPRESRCDTRFGDFYSAVTMNGTNFSFRGAMNADNPDTAKIIDGLIAGLLQQGVDSVPDKNAQTLLKSIRIMAKESEIILEADVPAQTVADFIREQTKATPPPAKAKPMPRRKRKPIRR